MSVPERAVRRHQLAEKHPQIVPTNQYEKRYLSDVILRDGSRAVEGTKGRSGHAARDETRSLGRNRGLRIIFGSVVTAIK